VAGVSRRVRIEVVVMVLAVESLAVAQTQPSASSAAPIACSPSALSVTVDESVSLHVWAPDAVSYQWTTTAGRVIQRTGEPALWEFKNVDGGRYTATVRVTSASGRVSSCSVVVRARLGRRGDTLISGRTLLMRSEREAGGYGLYTYLLFGSQPNETLRERFEAALDAYLDVIPEIEGFQQGVPPGRRNLTLLPVDQRLSEDLRSDRVAFKKWLLDHYDYSRAREILGVVSNQHRDGPYFLSCSTAPSSQRQGEDRCLFQSLASVPPHLIALWTKEFLNQAELAQYSGMTLDVPLMLRLRTAIGILAVGIPEVKAQLEQLIRLTKN